MRTNCARETRARITQNSSVHECERSARINLRKIIQRENAHARELRNASCGCGDERYGMLATGARTLGRYGVPVAATVYARAIVRSDPATGRRSLAAARERRISGGTAEYS